MPITTWLDTKLLSNKIGDILEGVFNAVRAKKGISNLTIIPSYRTDQAFELFQLERPVRSPSSMYSPTLED